MSADKINPAESPVPSVPALHYASPSAHASQVGGRSTFVRRVDILYGRLNRFKRIDWRGTIQLFSYIDISLAVLAVTLGTCTDVVCDINPEIAKWVAVANTIISALIALLKGTGVPASFIAIDHRARDLRYRLVDLEASCQHWEFGGLPRIAGELPENTEDHKAHVDAFLNIQSEYSQLSTDLSELWSQVFSGLGPKPSKQGRGHSDPTASPKKHGQAPPAEGAGAAAPAAPPAGDASGSG